MSITAPGPVCPRIRPRVGGGAAAVSGWVLVKPPAPKLRSSFLLSSPPHPSLYSSCPGVFYEQIDVI